MRVWAFIIGLLGVFLASEAQAQTVCPPTAVILNSIPYGRGPGNSSYNCMVPAPNSIVTTSGANVPSLVPKASILTAANILNYGAVASDNTKAVVNAAAFAAAFAASPSVYCPDGQTFYSQDVVVPATGTHLFGKCTIIAAGTMSIAGIVSQNNSAGLLIEDVKVQVSTGTYPAIYGILFNTNVGATIRNVSPSGLHAILFSNSSFISILNNPLGSFSGIGIYSNVGGTDILISGNTTSGGANGVVLTGSTRANISNNTVSSTSSIAISAAASSSYVNIAGNQVVNAGAGAGISFNVCTHCQAENNNINGSAAFGITASLGGDILISGNNTYATVREGVHIDSLDSGVISSNNLVFTGASADSGISVSNDNTTLATNVQVVGNNVVSPFGPCIYFIGAQYSTAIANNCRNANVGPSIVNSSIVLDGSMTQHNTIGTNTIEDTIGNNLYQVAEGNFTAGGTPSNNIIAQQLGPAGTTGFILASTTTNRIVRATSSLNNPDTISGFYFDASPFAQRSIPSTSVVLYDYSGLAVGSLGSAGTPTTFWANTTHEWWDRGVGTKFATLDTNSWSWRAVATAATPASGIGRVYLDSTTKALTNKDDAGTLHTTVIADTGAANNFLTAISAAGVISKAQPAFSNLSGSATCAQLPALTGDITTSAGTCATTLTPIIIAGGPTGSATVAPIITYDAKGRLTAVSSATITPAISSLTGAGTGVLTALGVNVGTAGAFIVNGGALGTPSSGIGTNLTGTASGLTAGNVTINANLTGDVTSVGNAATIAANAVTLAKLATQGANTILANVTAGTAFPIAASAPAGATTGCAGATEAVRYTNGTGFGCNIAINAATLGGATFASPSAIGTGISAAAAFTTGSYSGSVSFGATITFSAQANIGAGPGFSHSTGNTFLLAGGTSGYTFNNQAGTTNIMTLSNTGSLAMLGTLTVTGMTNVATTSAVCYNTGTGLVTYDGTLGTCTVSLLSAKNLIDPLTPEEGYEIVMKQQAWRYTMKPGLPTYVPGEQIGFVADFAAKKERRVVAFNHDGSLAGYRYEQYTAALTSAFQYRVGVEDRRYTELKADNDNLWAEISELKRANGR